MYIVSVKISSFLPSRSKRFHCTCVCKSHTVNLVIFVVFVGSQNHENKTHENCLHNGVACTN